MIAGIGRHHHVSGSGEADPSRCPWCPAEFPVPSIDEEHEQTCPAKPEEGEK